MPIKQSLENLDFQDLLNSPLDDVFDINDSTLNTIHISDPVLSSMDCLKPNEAVEALLVRDRKRVVGVISGREITANILSFPLEDFVKQSVGNIMTVNFPTIHEKTSVIDFVSALQRYRRGIGFIGDKTNIIGSVSFKDLLELFTKTTSSASVFDLPLHKVISVKHDASIREGMSVMLKNNIRRVFVESKDFPYVSERNIFGTIHDCVLKNDFSVLDKPITHSINNCPIAIKNESVKKICNMLNSCDSSCVTVNKKYVATPWDIVNSFLLGSVNEYREQLVEAEKLAIIGKLTTRIAHDIRNPLSIIQISLENLKGLYGTDENKEKHFERVNRAIDRITHQTNDVLDFIRKQPIEMSKEKFSDVLSDCLSFMQIPKNIELVLPKNDVRLLCEKKLFSTVFTNMILNSIQAINGIGTIEIIVEENDDAIVIQVKDSADALPKKIQEKIFEPLFTTKQSGTGLGLSSVKSIIESHGGIISVTSPPTTFTITLPKTSD